MLSTAAHRASRRCKVAIDRRWSRRTPDRADGRTRVSALRARDVVVCPWDVALAAYPSQKVRSIRAMYGTPVVPAHEPVVPLVTGKQKLLGHHEGQGLGPSMALPRARWGSSGRVDAGAVYVMRSTAAPTW